MFLIKDERAPNLYFPQKCTFYPLIEGYGYLRFARHDFTASKSGDDPGSSPPPGGGGHFRIEGDGDVPLDRVWFCGHQY